MAQRRNPDHGASVKIGASVAATSFVDGNTLTVTVPLMPNGPAAITVQNPDGTTYVFGDAFTVD